MAGSPLLAGIGLGSIMLMVFSVVVSIYWSAVVLPTPLSASAPQSIFSEFRARQLMQELCQQSPAHPTGTPYEQEVADKIVAVLSSLASSLPADGPQLTVSVRTDNPGSLLAFWDAPERQITWWSAMNNVVAVLNPPGDASSLPALLLSSHYDTVTMSPGCYDDTSGVAMMLEVLRNLASGPALRYPIIMAFVAGEEIDLLGAAAYVQSDPTMPTVAAFMDFDSTPGTKAMMFLSTGTWLDELYASESPRPFGSVLQHDVLSGGLVSSITDWEVFSKIGNLTGIGFGFASLRQYYHTTDDFFARFHVGSLQQFGDNILPLARAAASSPDLQHPPAPQEHVYFDLYNDSMVIYSVQLSGALHIVLLLLLLSLLLAIPFFGRHPSFRPDSWRVAGCSSLSAFATVLISFLLSLLTATLVSLILDAALAPAWFAEIPNTFALTTAAVTTLSYLFFAQLVVPALGRLLWKRCNCLGGRFRDFLEGATGDSSSPLGFTILPKDVSSSDSESHDAHSLLDDEAFDLSAARPPSAHGQLRAFACDFYGSCWFYLLLLVASAPICFSYGSTYLVFWPALFVFISLLLHEAYFALRPRWFAQPDDKDLSSKSPRIHALLTFLALLSSTFPMIVVLCAIIPTYSILLVGNPSVLVPSILVSLLTLLLVIPLIPYLSWISRLVSSLQRFIYALLLFFSVLGILLIITLPHAFSVTYPLQIMVSQRVAFESTPVALTAAALYPPAPMLASALRLSAQLSAKQLHDFLADNFDLRNSTCNMSSPTSSYAQCYLPVSPPEGLQYPVLSVLSVDQALRNVSFSVDFHNFGTARLLFSAGTPLAWSFDPDVQSTVQLVGGMPLGLQTITFWIQFPTSDAWQSSTMTLIANLDWINFPAISSFLAAMPQTATALGVGTGLFQSSEPFQLDW